MISMAARRLPKRVFPQFSQNQIKPCLKKEFSWRSLLSLHMLLDKDRNFDPNTERWIQRHQYSTAAESTEPTSKLDKSTEEKEDEPCSYISKPTEITNLDSSTRSVKYTAFSNLKSSKRHDLAMIYTCRVCETRSMKTMCRESYEKGVVVVRCGGCNNLHLIADRLGWFGEPGSIEDLLAAQGEEVKRGSLDTMNFTAEDLAGLKTS